jgi:hypothetical protein
MVRDSLSTLASEKGHSLDTMLFIAVLVALSNTPELNNCMLLGDAWMIDGYISNSSVSSHEIAALS